MPRIPRWKRRQWGKKGAEVQRLKKIGVSDKQARKKAQRTSREWVKKQYTAKQRKRYKIYPPKVAVLDHTYLHMIAYEYAETPPIIKAQLWLVTYKDIDVVDKAFKILKKHRLNRLNWTVETKTIIQEKKKASYYRIEEYIEGETYYVKGKAYHYDMKKKVHGGKV